MLELRHAEQRGRASFGWLESRHTFSFGGYHDPRYMGFGPLRVINEDRVQPGQGFGTHSHQDMEIISYVLGGALEHRDSLGTGSVIRPGDVQRMSAGTGVSHSEFNHSRSELVHFLQIWIIPERNGLPPSYEQRSFPETERRGRWRLVGSRSGLNESVTIHRDVDLYATLLDTGDRLIHPLREGRLVWLQVARGEAELDGEQLREGDGVAAADVEALSVRAIAPAELLLFDMAGT